MITVWGPEITLIQAENYDEPKVPGWQVCVCVCQDTQGDSTSDLAPLEVLKEEGAIAILGSLNDKLFDYILV